MPVVAASDLAFRALSGRASADPLPPDFGGGCSTRLVRIAAGADRTAHRHPHSVEVVYVAQGEGVAWEDGVATPVRAGDVIVVPRGVPHATVPTSDDGLLLVCFFPHPDLGANLEELDVAVEL